MRGLLRLRVLGVLEAFQRLLPEALADAKFCAARFVSGESCSAPLQLATLRLLAAADDSDAWLAAEAGEAGGTRPGRMGSSCAAGLGRQ
jgi:hypothetical protein